MIVIKKMEVKDNFKYLWLKGVNDVDLSNHCARSLIGQYSKVIHNNLKHIENKNLDVQKSKAYYLCGVTEPFRYNDNFHLAFKEKENAVINIERNGVIIEIQNAEEIPFSTEDIDYSSQVSRKSEYSTCRNWQFANKFKKEF